MTAREVALALNENQRTALCVDERAIEQLHWRDRDTLIVLGVACRAAPAKTADRSWHTWLTPLGIEVREMLMARVHG